MNEAEKKQAGETIATACRLMAYLGLVRETTGHVSLRSGPNRMLLRCRTGMESGLAFTQAEAVHEVSFDGEVLDGKSDFEIPTELPIHGEILKARPEINAVVHAHPRASVVCSISGLEMKPIIGGFDPNAMALGDAGVPVFPRSALIRQKALAHEMIETMGDKSVCILRAHGIVAVGKSVEEATLRAIKLETLAGITLDVAKTGATPESICAEDLEFFRNRDSASKKLASHSQDIWAWTWRHYVKLLEAHEAGRS